MNSPELNNEMDVVFTTFEKLQKNRKDFERFVHTPEPILLPDIDPESNFRAQIIPEYEQKVGSFKLAGPVGWFLAHEEVKAVAAPSAGNHAQGLAYVGREMNIPVTIFMPTSAPEIKQEAVRNMGADLRIVGENFEETKQACNDFAEQKSITVVPPYDHATIIAANAMLVEHAISKDNRTTKNTNHIFVPCGGGGLAAGLAIGANSAGISHHISITAVSPSSNNTAADGAAVNELGILPRRIFEEYGVKQIYVDETLLAKSMVYQAELTETMPEGAGALALAGMFAQFEKNHLIDQQVAIIASGKNIDPAIEKIVRQRVEKEHEGMLSGRNIRQMLGNGVLR